MYKTFIVSNDRLIPLQDKRQLHKGSVVAITDGFNTVFYKIDRLLSDKYINNWIPKDYSISSMYILSNKYLSPYFINSNELNGFFGHIGHFFSHAWHEVSHGVEHVAHEVGHGVEHVVHEVKVHPILLALPAAAAAVAIPGAIPAIGHVIGSIGSDIGTVASGAGHLIGSAASAIGIGSVAKTAAVTVAANLASSLINKPPKQVIDEGVSDLGLPPQQAQQIMQETDQYAQQNNIPQNIPYQQTLSYVASHWGYFIDHGFKSPQAAAAYILMKSHGIPPNPNEPPDTAIEAGIGSDIKKYLPFIAIGLVGLLLIEPSNAERNRPEIIFLGGVKNAKQQS